MSTATPAAIYCRISDDHTGEAAGVARQEAACRELCANLGHPVGQVYVDNDTSATSGKERPAFERLLADRPALIVTWHQDRLLRLTRDLERVIALDVPVHTVVAGSLDLSTPTGRAVARTVAAWSQHEVELKAARQRAANDDRAAAGLPYRCQRPFGYEADGMTVRDSEATELRNAAQAVIRGRSMSSLVRSLNDRGVRTASGRKWSTPSLRFALLSPRNAGLRQHRGEVVGPAAWPPIFDEETVAAVRTILNAPERRRPGGVRKYLLSGVLKCGKCGAGVTGAYVKDGNKGKNYRCPGHVSRKAERVDEYVMGVLTARLAQDDALSLFARDGDEARLSDLADQRQVLRDRLDGLAEAFAAGDIDMQAMTAGTKRVRAEVEAVEREIAAAAVNAAMVELLDVDDVSAELETLPVETVRQFIDTLMVLTLRPVGPGRRSLPDAGVEIEWRAGE